MYKSTMSELSIKVSIAGRVYPLTISAADEEIVRKAARRVDDQIKQLQSVYAVKDRQDLFAMAALQSATLALKATAKPADEALNRQLEQISSELDILLSGTH